MYKQVHQVPIISHNTCELHFEMDLSQDNARNLNESGVSERCDEEL